MKPEKYLNQQPQEFSTIYIDMNSFFASVEQYYNPTLRGRPVGVATAPSAGGTIVAASVEAKRLGIKGGIKVAEARSKCPEIVIVHDSPNSYRAIHRQIMDILHATPCYVRPKSIDEAYLKVPGYLQSKNSVLALIKAIKANLFERYNEHILCSAGVSSNIWLAKMASNSQKPNGLVFLSAAQYADFCTDLSLLDLTGINWRMARQLYSLGIYSPISLYKSSWRFLSNKLGVNGAKWYLRMRGVEVDTQSVKANKSISHQVTTMPNTPVSLVEITTYLNKIAVTLGNRLRKKGLYAGGISIHIKYVDGQYWGNTLKNTHFYRSDYEIISLSKMLLKKLNNFNKPIRKITITLLNLVEAKQQTLPLDLLSDKYLKLSEATDKINSKYGKNTIMPLRSYGAEYVNLNRVGFAGDILREKSNPTDREHHK